MSSLALFGSGSPLFVDTTLLLAAQEIAAGVRRLPDGQGIVGIREFIESPDYLNRPGQVWPGVMDDLIAMTQPGIQGCVIEQGIGGGKSIRFGLKGAYLAYKLKMMELLGVNLYEKYELLPDTPIGIVNVSTSLRQAKKVIFGYVSRFVDESPWFLEFMPRNKKKSSVLDFGNICIFPGGSKENTVIGENIFGGFIDEANFFETKGRKPGEEHPADILFRAIDSRISSRFGVDGYIGLCSSRKIKKDFTRLKIKAIEKDPETRAVFYIPPCRPSWELWSVDKKTWLDKKTGRHLLWRKFDVKGCKWKADENGNQLPDLIFTSEQTGKTVSADVVLVPETLWKDFSTDPEGSLRDHASIVPEAENPFFRRRDAIKPDFDKAIPLKAHVKPEDWCDPEVDFEDLFEDWFRGEPGYRYHFHVDPSLRRDASGFAISCQSGEVEDFNYSDEELRLLDKKRSLSPLMDAELLVQVRAPKGGEIDLSVFRRLVIWLRDERGFRFGKSSTDGWQSKDNQQMLKRKGIEIEEFSLDRKLDGYNNLKDAIYDGRFFFYPARGQTPETTYEELVVMAEAGDPSAVFQVELYDLMLVDGVKADHPVSGSKDVSDAVAGSVWQVASKFRRTAV